MNFEKMYKNIKEHDLVIHTNNTTSKEILLNNEALFQLPFLSIVVLLLSKNRKKPKIDKIGQLVGECLELSMKGFKGSSQHLGWSANLRIRTITALSFLEMSNLVLIDIRKQTIIATKLGIKVIEHALSKDNELSFTMNLINRKYRDINCENKIKLELYEAS